MTLIERRAPVGARFAPSGARMAAASASRVLMAEPAPAPAPKPAAPAPQPPPAPVAVPIAVPVQSPPPPPPAPEEPPPPPAPTEEEQGDMPAEEADEQPRRNTPSSPVPAHPQALANACMEAGFPELIAPLMASGATMAQVKRRLADATGIRDAAKLAGLPAMAPAMIRAGMSLDDAQSIIFSARAGAADATPIHTAHAGATAGSGAKPPPEVISVAEGTVMMKRRNAAARGP